MIKKNLVLFVSLLTITCYAQNNNVSPYSFFGIGEAQASKTVEEISMGEIGVAMSGLTTLNFSNPASYASLTLTSYAIGGANNFLTVKSNDGEDKASNSSLSYIAIGIPMGKIGMTFGLQPKSTTGYSLNQVDDIGTTFFNGEGGTNRFFLGLGYKIIEQLSIGVEGQYVFGSLDNSIVEERDDVQLATKYETKTKIKGASIKLGLQYKDSISNKLKLHAGASIEFAHDLEANGEEYLYSLYYTNGAELPRDTLLSQQVAANYAYPVRTSLGVGVGKDYKWYAAVNYTFQDALSFSGTHDQSNSQIVNYEKASVISVGGFYIPKINSISSYWNRVTYRAGLKLEKTGLAIDGIGDTNNFTSIEDFGMSFGLGLPVGKNFSKLNLGFEIGKRGTTDNNLIQENYFNLRMSLSLNDKWFKKRKIN